MAPSAAAICQSDQPRVGLPRSAGNQQEGYFRSRMSLNSRVQLRQAGRSFAVLAVISPAFGSQPRILECVADMRVGLQPGRGTSAAQLRQVVCVPETHLHRLWLTVNIRLRSKIHLNTNANLFLIIAYCRCPSGRRSRLAKESATFKPNRRPLIEIKAWLTKKLKWTRLAGVQRRTK